MHQRLEKPPTPALKQRTALSLQHFIPSELKLKAVLPPQKHHIHTLKRRTVLLVVTLVALMAFVPFAVMSYIFVWTWTGFPANGTLWDWLTLFILPTALGVGTIWFTTQPRWHVGWTVALVVVLAVFMVLVWGGYFSAWAWTGFSVKEKGDTLWNWIQLLLVPLIVLAVAKVVSTHQSQVSDTMGKQQQTDLQLAHEHQQEIVLEAYLNHMSDLLRNRNLSRSQPGSDVRTIARALTLTALQMVGKNRKGVLLQFLHEAGLITKNKTIIDLRRGDLREADLSGADLREADLSGVDLSGANLSGANLSGARLIESKVTAEQLATALSLNGATARWINVG
jgi:Pentapeptide repeats (8 copies)